MSLKVRRRADVMLAIVPSHSDASQVLTSDSRESRSCVGTPISSKKLCRRSMMVVTCWDR
jgi:hypothetical protein